MNSYKTSNGYLLLFRGTDWHLQLSPEEIQRVMGDWGAWFKGLDDQGKLAAANPLENEGAVISGKARSVADGPFAEAKESIGGFFLLKVETMEEAMAIAKDCPALPYGITVEVRPVAPACPAQRMVDEVSEHAMA
ncbi:YciI family protein [Haloferula sp. BvORR071]|uniref:YciI family protein n=1 Tax=Haloferula sp. BvORR071 TaxID=1396141 RepID=UPI000554A89E|nr:YciI family protein [Haloferula sp. BvORR071]